MNLDLKAVIADLRRDLLNRATDISLVDQPDPRLELSLNWLIASQAADGSFGYESPAVTALAVLAIVEWRPAWSQTEGFQLAASFLRASGPGGKLETVWDTAVALRAMTQAGFDNEWVAAMHRHLSAITPDRDRVKTHHAAQLLAALWKRAEDREKLEEWSGFLLERIDHADGCYAIGQAVWAELHVPTTRAGLLRPWRDSLVQRASSMVVNKSNFSEYCSCLMALSLMPEHGVRPQVVNRLDNLFQDGYRKDGSWYHEPWETAWALLAARSAGTVRRVALTVPELNHVLESADHQLDRIENDLDRLFGRFASHGFWMVCGLSVMTSALLAVILYGLVAWERGLSLTLVGAATPALGLALRGLFVEFRRFSIST